MCTRARRFFSVLAHRKTSRVPRVFSRMALHRGSSNRTLAAAWNTNWTSFNFSWLSSFNPIFSREQSPGIGTIFWILSGCVSRILSNNWKHLKHTSSNSSPDAQQYLDDLPEFWPIPEHVHRWICLSSRATAQTPGQCRDMTAEVSLSAPFPWNRNHR